LVKEVENKREKKGGGCGEGVQDEPLLAACGKGSRGGHQLDPSFGEGRRMREVSRG